MTARYVELRGNRLTSDNQYYKLTEGRVGHYRVEAYYRDQPERRQRQCALALERRRLESPDVGGWTRARGQHTRAGGCDPGDDP